MSQSEADLDMVMLEGLKKLLADKFDELITTFNSDCAARIGRIADALPDQNFTVICHEAHGVKGSCRNMGVNSLAELCDKMESKARVQDGSDMEQLFAAIEQQFAAASNQLISLLP